MAVSAETAWDPQAARAAASLRMSVTVSEMDLWMVAMAVLISSVACEDQERSTGLGR